MLPNSIQPLPLKKINTPCFMAVHENSPILLGTVVFMAEFHECMKRTKDSCGRLVATFSNQTVLRYKTLTLKKLSDHLTKTSQGACVTEADILCIVILLFCETIAGDRPAVNAHLLGLTRIIQSYGGQQALSPIVATHIRLTTLLAAQLDQTPPILELSPAMQNRYEKVSTTPFIPENHVSQGFEIGSAFFLQPLCYALSSALQKCLRYMHQVIKRVEKYHDSARVLEGEWMDDVLTLEHTLLSLPHKAALSKLEECVRLAGLLYCNTALWKIPLYLRWVMSLVAHLKLALLSLNRREYPGLHFWMLFLGRQACTLEFWTAEIGWWNAAVGEAAVELGINSWEEACRAFQGYFYIERTHATRWRAVWADIENGTCSLDPICHPCDYR
ncbi:hypothetical protein G7Y79_00008g024550 [Physcia stellaris]|nr:hypothetical protein G7Y79_00008g024550 [Physcia stellaris]